MSTPVSIIAAQVGSDDIARAVLQKLKIWGWVCVPDNPSAAMVEAAYWSAYGGNAQEVWSDMILASLSEQGELKDG